MTYQLFNEDNLDVLRRLPSNSVDAVVTDPPYGLGKEPDALGMLHDWLDTGHHEVRGKGFMGKTWDAFVPQPAQWREVYRVLKPGGHVLSFAGTRTQDLMTLGLRLAGFEIRDLVAWVYGSGFPKSHNLEEEWEGWGTALKPALEPITMARKPLEGTVAANVLKWHTGAINVDGCRVHTDDSQGGEYKVKRFAPGADVNKDGNWKQDVEFIGVMKPGRWPANVIHDGSEEVVSLFPDSVTKRIEKPSQCQTSGLTSFDSMRGNRPARGYDGSGSAARFFYCAKVAASERNAGLESLPDKEWKGEGAAVPQREERPFNPSKNNHPTVKPIALMRYLCRLITPPGGVVLDPWMGSGSTGIACAKEGFSFIGIDADKQHGYFKIAQARVLQAYPDEDFC